MTIKQRKLAKGLAKGLTGKDAAIQAGYREKSAKCIASDYLNDPKHFEFQGYLWKLLDRQGLTDRKLLSPVREALKANRVISARVIIKSDDPSVKLEEATSRTDDFIEVPDHPTRLKAAELGLKLRGYLKDTAPSGGPVQQLVVIVRTSTEASATPHADSSTDGH